MDLGANRNFQLVFRREYKGVEKKIFQRKMIKNYKKKTKNHAETKISKIKLSKYVT